jgi:CheY-like chemotaxis protein
LVNLKHRILWLDDDLESARTFAGVLDSNLCKIQFVLSTQELCRYLSEPWDLIVLDLQLSTHDWEGLDFLLDFRRSNRATPILVCTGKGSKREVKKAFELGADALVFKEDIAEELVIAVDKLLDPSLRFNGIVEQFPTQ